MTGSTPFPHPFGCSQTGGDHAQTRKLLAALTAAGAQLILFTTGRGTPFGAPAPTMKIATSTPLLQKNRAGLTSTPEASADLMALVLEVASGKQNRTEEKGYREISIFKDGVVL